MPTILNYLNPSNWKYIRDVQGNHFTQIGKLNPNYKSEKEKLDFSFSNYPLFTCLLITSNIVSKVKFQIKKGDEFIDDDPLLTLLNNPNYLQSKDDFIKEFIWYKLIYGWSIMRPVLASGHNISPENCEAIFNLNNSGVYYPNDFTTPMLYTKEEITEFKEQFFQYRRNGTESKFQIKELLFFYDVANGLCEETLLKSPSRLDAVWKSICNVDITLDAENVMLHSNGREIFSGGEQKGANSGMAMPLQKEDRKEIENKLMHKYGLSRGQTRSIVTKSGINWQSLHIALKDLGLAESSTKNAAIIRSVFQIPETVYKLYNEKGDTFENKKEGEIEFIQNVAQPHINDLCSTLNSFFGYEKTPLVGTFDHLPAMQHTEDKKADKLLKISAAIRNLNMAGFTEDMINDLMVQHGLIDIKS